MEMATGSTRQSPRSRRHPSSRGSSGRATRCCSWWSLFTSIPAPLCRSLRAKSSRTSLRKDPPSAPTPRICCLSCRGHNLKAPCAVSSPHHVPWNPASQQVSSCRGPDFKAPRAVDSPYRVPWTRRRHISRGSHGPNTSPPTVDPSRPTSLLLPGA